MSFINCLNDRENTGCENKYCYKDFCINYLTNIWKFSVYINLNLLSNDMEIIISTFLDVTSLSIDNLL